MPSVTVWTRLALPGFHRWPGATGRRAYLADRHRHLFHLEVEVAVGHDDRDVEFHDLQDLVRDWWGDGPRELGAHSCEQIARDLAAHLTGQGITVTRVTVSEDAESGATLRFPNGAAQ